MHERIFQHDSETDSDSLNIDRVKAGSPTDLLKELEDRSWATMMVPHNKTGGQGDW